MIVESIFNGIFSLITTIFSFIQLPQVPDAFSHVVDYILDMIVNGLSIVLFFVDVPVFLVCLSISLIVINFDRIYRLVMFIVRKIPFLGLH